MAKNKGSGSKGKARSAASGRYVTQANNVAHGKSQPKTTLKKSRAGEFADRFIERHPETFHELSKR